MVIYFFYAIGVALNGLVFYLFDSWQLALFFYQIVPFIIVLLGLVFFIEETPFDQVIYYSPENSLASFQRIAKINGTEEDYQLSV
jgi:hypothetical protein